MVERREASRGETVQAASNVVRVDRPTRKNQGESNIVTPLLGKIRIRPVVKETFRLVKLE